MHIVVLDVLHIGRVPVMCESGESSPVKVSSEGSVAGHQAINTHVKLFATDEEGIDDVSLHNVGLSLRAFGLPPEIILPLGDLLKFIE